MTGLSEEVAGAWLGGTIDTTAAVVASGKFIGETAEKYSVIIKSAQNVLLGVAAFAISIYWSYKGTNSDIRPSGSVLWERFPKFVLGFMAASLLFSFAFDLETGKALSKVANKKVPESCFSHWPSSASDWKPISVTSSRKRTPGSSGRSSRHRLLTFCSPC